MESPWSTPTQSEIGDAEATLNAKSRLMLDGLDSNIRELGDGEPGLDLTPGEEFSPENMADFDDEENSQGSPSPVQNKKKGPKGSGRNKSKSPSKARSPSKSPKKSKKKPQGKQ